MIGGFHLGRVVVTPGVLETLTELQMADALRRHAGGDWSEMDDHDRQANTRAVDQGGRVLSTYHYDDNDVTVWVISERDRSATTLLLPEEY